MKIKDILLVDDDRVAGAFIEDILVDEGFSVRYVIDGKEALGAIRSKAPDAIFTDLIMPKISGEELVRQVREMPGMDEVPIVVVTATIAEQNETLHSIPADAFIPKLPPETFRKNMLLICKQLKESGTISTPLSPDVFRRLPPRRIVKELLTSLEYQETIFERLSEGFLIVDTDFRILKVNSLAARFLGEDATHLIDQPFSEIFANDEKKRIEDLLTGLFAREDTNDKRITVTHNSRILDLKFSNLVDQISQKVEACLVLIEDI
ncbi:MAG: response regulator, partial [Deltaproteobacteria bacterium]|nr:response regulator [Deltaproteobacteria bacterium]